MKSSVTEFSRVLCCKQQFCLILVLPLLSYLHQKNIFYHISALNAYIKKRLRQGQFLEMFEGAILPTESLRWIPILVATCNIFKNRTDHGCCPSGCCEKYNVQSTQLRSAILIKKSFITGLALCRNLKNGVWLKRFAEGVLFPW